MFMMTSFLFSPLEQFNVVAMLPFKLSAFFSSSALYIFTNSNILLLLIFFFFFSVVSFALIQVTTAIFTPVISLVGSYYSFVISLLKENFSQKNFYFFPYIFSLFSFLLLANLFGMVPYSFALTSHLIITLALSFLTFFSSIYICIATHGWYFFSLFLPSGAPVALIPFLIILELISFCARLFSLAIRLFANIMSGHTLLKILASFVWLLFINISLLSLAPFIVIVAVSFLEFGIAALQAYVFTVLSCIYLNEALVLH